jgi:plasmid stabilization system protein ParE
MKAVVVGRLARREITEAASFYEGRQPGLGAEFADRVAEALELIKLAPEGYQVVHGDMRRVNLRQFRDWALWFRVLADNSVVIACLSNRMNPEIVKERALGVLSIRPKP